MSKEFLGRGWAFPVRLNEATGEIATSEYEDDIREAILIILSTSKGERIMQPDFGCGIHEFVFSPVDTTTQGLVESSVREALTLWEPRINVIDVTSKFEHEEQTKLVINISYKVRSTNNQYNLVYPFYLREG